jgi:predicted ATPase
MIHLRSVERRGDPEEAGPDASFAFRVPAIQTLERIEIEHEVLFLVGENGSGKSTLLEALALASRRIAVGAQALDKDPTLDAVRPLSRALRLGWSRRTSRGFFPRGFFLRAEDFFSFAKGQRSLSRELSELADSYDDPRVRGYIQGQSNAMMGRYEGDLDELSHGESFMRLFQSRVVPKGLYLIDEPEAALSPKRQLSFLSFLKQMTGEDCQFVIATHSPILLSYPGAQILSFDDGQIQPRVFEELEHVQLTRDFLACPERYWRHL